MSTTALPAIAAVTFSSDRAAITHLQAVNHGRRAGTERAARDIAQAAHENVVGPRPARHRKDQP